MNAGYSAKKECACPLAKHEHGTAAAFVYCGCHCYPCRNAYLEQRQRLRDGQMRPRSNSFIDRTGTRRRLEALHANGWSGTVLAEQLGLNSFQVVYLLRTSPSPVTHGTAAKVARLYDQLWDKQPTGGDVLKTTNWALRRGFAPPLAWDDTTIDDPNAEPALTGDDAGIDEVAVLRYMEGTLGLPLNARTPPEVVEAIRRLAAHGLDDVQIGDRIGRGKNAVAKLRERNSIPSGLRVADGRAA